VFCAFKGCCQSVWEIPRLVHRQWRDYSEIGYSQLVGGKVSLLAFDFKHTELLKFKGLTSRAPNQGQCALPYSLHLLDKNTYVREVGPLYISPLIRLRVSSWRSDVGLSCSLGSIPGLCGICGIQSGIGTGSVTKYLGFSTITPYLYFIHLLPTL
jgi:hypothetical protein